MVAFYASSRFLYLWCLFLWLGWTWRRGSNIGNKVRLVHPLFSCYSTLLLAAYFRQSSTREEPRVAD